MIVKSELAKSLLKVRNLVELFLIDKCNIEQISFGLCLLFFYYNTFKNAITFFLIRNWVLAKKQENYNPSALV